MKILTQDTSSLTYQDIVDFCQERYPEGVQLDYKQHIPVTGLSKHFAAFSNTRGGAIIIGVEEDPKSGMPKNWNGISDVAKTRERIHQYASNVDPRPRYDVHATDGRDDKAFIIVRIFEGDQAPYYVQNDPILYIRTGNITDLIGPAAPETAKMLHRKQDQAWDARTDQLAFAEKVYQGALMREERERKRLLMGGEKACTKPIGEDMPTLTVSLQPYFPQKPSVAPSELMAHVQQYARSITDIFAFPDVDLRPIPEGALHFWWGHYDGAIDCHEFYSKGLIFCRMTVLRADEEKQIRHIYLTYVFGRIFHVLKTAQIIYSFLGYQGGLVGTINLSGAAGSDIRIIDLGRSYVPVRSAQNEGFLDLYSRPFEVDTNVLSNDETLLSFFLDLGRELYWDFGLESYRPEIIKTFLKDSRLIS